jgi:hypothetical protein
MSDYIVRATAANASIRAFAINAKDLHAYILKYVLISTQTTVRCWIYTKVLMRCRISKGVL